ncbi:MAG: hypothetical protein KAT68_05790 [Bacteroidales bacterium]|nr:hypothetical protein [Bacteroidales bacterium]
MIQIWQYIKNNGDLLILAVILIVVFILFVRDFDLKSKRSWMILFGLSALGAVIFYKAVKKNRLLKELERREKRLKELENEYEELKINGEITKENFRVAKEKLDEAKKKTALDILRADEKYEEELKELERKIHETAPEDMVLRARRIINNNQ